MLLQKPLKQSKAPPRFWEVYRSLQVQAFGMGLTKKFKKLIPGKSQEYSQKWFPYFLGWWFIESYHDIIYSMLFLMRVGFMGLLDRPQLLDVCLSAPSKIQLRLVKDAFGCTNIVFSKMQHLKRYMTYKYIYIYMLIIYIYILIVYMMAASGLPVPPPRMGWVQNLRFSYIFMEPAKTHGIYTVLTSSASETVIFAAFCNTTLYTTTLIVLLLHKQQQLLLLLPLLRTTYTYYYVLLRTTTYYYVLLRTTTYYYVRLRTTTYYYVLLRTTYTYYVYVLYVLRIRTTYYYVLRTTYYYVLRIRTTYMYYVYVLRIRIRTTYYYVMCICSIFVCIHNKNDIPTLRAHVHTYIQTNHKSIQTKISHT